MLSFVLDVLKWTVILLVAPMSIVAYVKAKDIMARLDHPDLLEFPAPAGYYTPEQQAEVRGKRTQLAVLAANHAGSGISPVGSTPKRSWKAWLRSKLRRREDTAEWRHKRAIKVSDPFMRPA